jgi:mxaA protein
MRRLALAALFALSLAEAATAHVRNVRAVDPRAFGYFVGDVIERTFEIDTDRGDTLTDASLPHAGPLTYWLELKSVTATRSTPGDVARYTLKIAYQIFYVPVDPRKLEIPPVTIAFRNGESSYNVTLPPFTFLVSPLREIFPEKSGETIETFLRADAGARFLPVRSLHLAMAASGIASLLALAALAYQLAWWPFNKRMARPFTRAARETATLIGEGQNSDSYRQALLELHRALDSAAGQRLMAADVPAFVSRHSEHSGRADDLARFFEASRSAFFANDPAAAERLLSPGALVDLAGRLAREERAAR